MDRNILVGQECELSGDWVIYPGWGGGGAQGGVIWEWL
jgi:hypothetical protein